MHGLESSAGHPHSGGSEGTADPLSRLADAPCLSYGHVEPPNRTTAPSPGASPKPARSLPAHQHIPAGRQAQTALGTPIFQPRFTVTDPQGRSPYFTAAARTALTTRRSHELRERSREAAISGRRLIPPAPGPPPPARRPAPLPGPAAARRSPGAGAVGRVRRGLPSPPAQLEESRSAAAPPPPGAAPHRLGPNMAPAWRGGSGHRGRPGGSDTHPLARELGACRPEAAGPRPAEALREKEAAVRSSGTGRVGRATCGISHRRGAGRRRAALWGLQSAALPAPRRGAAATTAPRERLRPGLAGMSAARPRFRAARSELGPVRGSGRGSRVAPLRGSVRHPVIRARRWREARWVTGGAPPAAPLEPRGCPLPSRLLPRAAVGCRPFRVGLRDEARRDAAGARLEALVKSGSDLRRSEEPASSCGAALSAPALCLSRRPFLGYWLLMLHPQNLNKPRRTICLNAACA